MTWWALLERLRCLYPAVGRHFAGADENPRLRPYLSETFSAWPFTDAAVEVSPTSPGVYLLYGHGRLIYIGLAVNGSGIRQELQSHRRGAYGSCTQAASAFLYELSADPMALHRHYLTEHRERYGGRLPPCNEPAFPRA
jgi:hypothetical protein